MKMLRANFLKVCTLVMLLLFTVSCKNSGKKNNDSQTIDKTEVKAELEEVAYPLPSPFELTKMINEIEATYIIGIANDPEAYKRYLTVKKQGLNLGVYSSDMAYSATYNRNDKTQEYLSSIKELVKSLDLTGAIKSDMPERIEASLDDKEESVSIITDLFYDTYSYMHKNNNTELSYLILAGTWIEGMYLVTNISDNTMENVEILKVIVKQETSLKKIVELMNAYKDSEMSKDIYSSLQNINATYELEEGTDALSMEQMIEISQQVAALRSTIVK